jgi:hypothetical protein
MERAMQGQSKKYWGDWEKIKKIKRVWWTVQYVSCEME